MLGWWRMLDMFHRVRCMTCGQQGDTVRLYVYITCAFKIRSKRLILSLWVHEHRCTWQLLKKSAVIVVFNNFFVIKSFIGERKRTICERQVSSIIRSIVLCHIVQLLESIHFWKEKYHHFPHKGRYQCRGLEIIKNNPMLWPTCRKSISPHNTCTFCII